MITWLDFRLFGNGGGLGAPYHDQRFYWLSGQFYTFMHGFGAQLHSFQWRHPKPGERRRICGRDFVVLHGSRRGPRVQVAWCMVGLPRDIDEANAAIRQLEQDLGRIG
ncbi:hypothetical protein [Labrys sp. WJW]|uniref:hypothetical protein n=1 Tax=Labrys sp. WJW TaxID=1737983 RepID=UPI0012E9A2D5|nr:hypothetical protein [Labrys sp. WJW]